MFQDCRGTYQFLQIISFHFLFQSRLIFVLPLYNLSKAPSTLSVCRLFFLLLFSRFYLRTASVFEGNRGPGEITEDNLFLRKLDQFCDHRPFGSQTHVRRYAVHGTRTRRHTHTPAHTYTHTHTHAHTQSDDDDADDDDDDDDDDEAISALISGSSSKR